MNAKQPVFSVQYSVGAVPGEALEYLRGLVDRLAAALMKYQARYHGAAHAQKHWEEAAALLVEVRKLKVMPVAVALVEFDDLDDQVDAMMVDADVRPDASGRLWTAWHPEFLFHRVSSEGHADALRLLRLAVREAVAAARAQHPTSNTQRSTSNERGVERGSL